MKPMMNTHEFRENLFNGKLSRRQAHRIMASFGICSIAVPLHAPSATAGDSDPDFFTWGGYDSPEFTASYREKYGGDPNYSFFADEEEAFNKMRAGYTPDLTFPTYQSVRKWNDAGFLAPVDQSRLSNWDDLLEPLKNIPGIRVDGELLFVPED